MTGAMNPKAVALMEPGLEILVEKLLCEMDEEAKKFPIVTKVEKNITLNSVMSNSFGFGGTNATLIFEKV